MNRDIRGIPPDSSLRAICRRRASAAAADLHWALVVADLLIADRFVALTPARWFDLGTGAPALLRIEPMATTMAAQAQWAERCAVLCALWHPALLPCIDFGVLGTTHRFEAYRLHARAPAHMGAGAGSTRGIEQLLAAAGVPAPRLIGELGGAAARAVLPAPIDAAVERRAERGDPGPCSAIGLRLVRRRAMAAIEERLDREPRAGWSLVDIAAPLGSGGRTLLDWCAREGRRRGWVPMTTDAWPVSALTHAAPAWVRLLEGRHVLVLHDGRGAAADDRRVSRIVLQLASARGSRHLLLRLVLPASTSTTLALEPVPDAVLASAVVTAGRPRGLGARVTHALHTARGMPGAFVTALLGGDRPRATTPPTVHETAVPYQVPEPRVRLENATVRATRPFEIRDARIACLCTRGRHAAAERIAARRYAAARRRGLAGEAADAARVRAALSRALGRSTTVREWLMRAATQAAVAADPHLGALVAVEQAHVLLDLMDLDAADAAARAGEAAATLQGDTAVQAAAWLARARIAWWRGQPEEVRMLAERVLAQASREESGGGPTVASAHLWCARAALAAGDVQGARAALRQARRAAADDPQPRPGLALVEASRLSVLGDLGAAARVAAETRCARHEGRALVAAAFDALAVEGCLLHGEAPAARGLDRLRRRVVQPLPPLLGARLELALLQGTDPDRAALRRCRVSESGARALLHVVPGVPRRGAVDGARSPMVDDVVAVLRMCQEHEDPKRALEQLARFVHAQGRCTSVVLVAAARAPTVVAAMPNVPAAPAIARRAIDSGAIVGPAHVDGAIELAVPVRCAAATIGAIVCRWLDEPPMTMRDVVAWLDAVAVACAPCVQAVADRLDPPSLPILSQELLGESAAIEDVRRVVARAADAPYPVLIEGESGVGKELVARAIHRAGPRRTRAFAALNCAALPDELIEAELFGHARGAFTGALLERRGLFEEADGGVLFLDEVGELSARAQAKLLRALQEGEIRRVGEAHARRVDVRIVAATNRSLAAEVEQGRFRRDLWYRLDVIHVRVPALRERPDDVPLLARAFWQRASERVGSRAVLGPAVLAALARYDWPGNVRELQNVIAALAVAAPRRGIVPGSCLPESLARLAEQQTAVTLDVARRGFEARFVRAALARAGGHRGRAASELGLTRQGLVKLLERLGLASDDSERAGEGAGRPG